MHGVNAASPIESWDRLQLTPWTWAQEQVGIENGWREWSSEWYARSQFGTWGRWSLFMFCIRTSRLVRLNWKVRHQNNLYKPQSVSSWFNNWRLYIATAHKASYWSWPRWKYGSFFVQFIHKSAFISQHVPLCESAAQAVRASLCFHVRAGAAWLCCLARVLNTLYTVIGTWE